MAKVFDTDVGTAIVLDTGIDLATVTKKAIRAQPPTGSVVELAVDVVQTKKLRHIKTKDTLNADGAWQLQAYVEFENGATKYHGEICTLRVYTALKVPSS